MRLACLSDENGTWSIFTRKDKGDYLKVSGPFDTRMTVETVATLNLPDNMNLYWEEPSTVVCVRVPMDVVRTVQRQGRRLMNLVLIRTWLAEHLGVTYRGYLEQNPNTMDAYAKIVMTIGENVCFVAPVEVPVMRAYEEILEVELGGESVKMAYRYGALNAAKCETLVQGSRARYYYQNNQPTQGIDIRLGKRVIATAMLSEIWVKENGSPIQRHNHYNDFVGELCIPELPRGVLATLNNKTGIDRTDPGWEAVFEALQQYQPPKNATSYEEAELKRKWVERLRAADDDNDVSTEVSVWPTGTRIDVVASNPMGKYDIYELKVRKAEPPGPVSTPDVLGRTRAFRRTADARYAACRFVHGQFEKDDADDERAACAQLPGRRSERQVLLYIGNAERKGTCVKWRGTGWYWMRFSTGPSTPARCGFAARKNSHRHAIIRTGC